MIKACVYSLKLVRKGEYDIILAPNNTLPNLVSTYFVHLMSHLPICVVVHHLDALSVTQKQNFFTIYKVYRKVGYEKITSLIKTFCFIFTLLILRRVNACLTVSKTTAKILVQNGVKKDKIYTSGNGVHCPKVAKANNSTRLYDGIFVGRIAKEKGIYDLVYIWQRIVQIRKKSKLIVVGGGPELSNLKREIKEKRLENNVILKGSCSEEELGRLMRESKVFVFPSVFEGWGLAVAEALACGLPAVCYDIPAVNENFGKCKSVFLVKPWDIESFTQKVLEIVCMHEEEYRRLSIVSRKYATRFDWEHVLARDLRSVRHAGAFKGNVV